ncbi:sensor histidine kinase [Streptomyces sp. NPDC086091]|uniref:sensor histidine kinase n=1 Tax=Streptomyces sp. NPDC086091 TaxID=3365751 RepID=UPI00381D7A99
MNGLRETRSRETTPLRNVRAGGPDRSVDGRTRTPVPAWAEVLGPYGRPAAPALDVALALLVVAAVYQYAGPYDMAVGGAMALCLLARRSRPGTVLTAELALAMVQFILHDVPEWPLTAAPAAYDCAILIAMMSVIHHGRSAWMPYAAGVVVLLATGAGMVGVPGTDVGAFVASATDLMMLWAITLTVWFTTFALRVRRLYAESQAARAEQAERERGHLTRIAAAEERAAIARELHDVVAHSLAVMILQADGAGYVLKSSPERAQEALAAIADTGRDALGDMHRIVRVLRGTDPEPTTGDEEDRRRVTLDEIRVAADRARTAGLALDVLVDVPEGTLSPAQELTAFRIVQECLTNVLRHAGPGARTSITVREDAGTLSITAVDDGAGHFPAPRPDRPTGGHGLVGMRERVEVAGGTFTAGPRVGAGWRVEARIPVNRAA